MINRKTNKIRRSTSTASPVDDGGPSSSASLASTVDSSNFDELLVDVESVPKHLGTDCPDLVEVASKPGFLLTPPPSLEESSDLLRVCYNHDHKANLPVEPSTAVPTPELRGPIPQRSSNGREGSIHSKSAIYSDCKEEGWPGTRCRTVARVRREECPSKSLGTNGRAG